MVEEMLAARGISVAHETIRQWGLNFGREFANRIRLRAPRPGEKWHPDEVVISIAGKKHWLRRAVDRTGWFSPFYTGVKFGCSGLDISRAPIAINIQLTT
jgi:transposase-like protein